MIVANAQAEPIANLASHEANRNRGHESRFGGDGAIRAPWPDVKIKGHVSNQHKFSTPYPIHYFLGATDSIHYFSGATTQIHHNAPPHDPDYHFWTATDPNSYFFAPPYPIHHNPLPLD